MIVVGTTAMEFYSRGDWAQLDTTKKSGNLELRSRVEISDRESRRENIRDKGGF